MRFKFLLFPITLIISFCVLMIYILPDIQKIGPINNEIKENEQKLEEINEREMAVKAFNVKMDENKDNELFIKNYLPSIRSEERIINAFNYIAADTGVIFEDITMKNYVPVEENISQDNSTAATISNATAGTKMSSSGETSGQIQAGTQSTEKMSNIEASIKVIGDYSKIKMFLDKVEHMPMMNSIRILDITKAAESPYLRSHKTSVTSTNLFADIKIDFNYIKSYQFDHSNPNFNVLDLDVDTIDATKEYVSENIPALEDSKDGKGEENPFLP
jgi:hypothetical protein